ncbi:MAG: alcohol dehydrogenase catalytic domain-containing protein [Burkholderiales bacterium]
MVDVHAAGVSFPEVLQTRGEYQLKPPLPFVPGSEVAGTVRSAPEGAGVKPGDRVAAFCMLGGFAEVAVAPEFLTFALPDSLDFAQGAGLILNYHTAYFSLVTRGRLQAGETVLVHGAAGGIGTATLQTLLGCVAHPRALTLCDVLAKRGYLESLAHEIRVTHGFRGEIDIATSSGRLPDKVYQSTFFVGATNAPDVIDVDRLNRGSIVVDDSFPLCFDLQKARRRFESKADILCVAGGSVAPNSAIDWDLALPPGIATMVRDGAALRPPSAAITGCILSSLMPASGLRPTLGAVSLDDCRHYWDGFASLGIKAGPLHCGPWTLTTMDLHRFRSQDQATDPHAARLPQRGAASAVERL